MYPLIAFGASVTEAQLRSSASDYAGMHRLGGTPGRENLIGSDSVTDAALGWGLRGGVFQKVQALSV